MHIFILRKSVNFQAVVYNLDKADKNQAELITAKNFGALEALAHPGARDYQNYLAAQAARNPRIQFPQFHAVLSVKGQSRSAAELGVIAEQWLVKMGYGQQPYLLFFHKDTANHHVHIVSTRVDQQGRKITQAFEQIKAWEVLNEITGFSPEQSARQHLDTALTYTFSTEDQFLALLKAKGYAIRCRDMDIQFYRLGKVVSRISRSEIAALLKQQSTERKAQIQDLIKITRQHADPGLYPIDQRLVKGWASQLTGYSSELAEMLIEQHRLEIVFHHRYGYPPDRFTLIDHAQKQVFDGDQLISFDTFIRVDPKQTSGKGFSSIPDHSPENQPAYSDWFTGLQVDISDDVDDEQVYGRYRRKNRPTSHKR